ncbi:2-nitropropane dioxygenase [Sanghuangporus baumii]|uniref:2-nitropropane dioxygenase n=1 Tax=Sanghuangporus baumii TaxID=108892 RepID=A0A9Q5HQQ1_SANBA|nr:2-nitropropane dioxygenase [Sanghuangporus baumii]
MPSSPQVFKTPLTELFNIKHPVMLAGMNVAAGPRLAAAVTNAGGIGVIGGLGQTPKNLQRSIDEIKEHLEDKNAPFGVDLLIPQVGGKARKTNHVQKALDQGVDIICAQGGEGGGHTGDTPFSVLIPACIDICKNAKSPLNGKPVLVVAAGGIADGRGLAASLAYGAAGVWVGTRFVASVEAGAPKMHKELIVSSGYDDFAKTTIYTGRPLQVRKTDYIVDWEENRRDEIKKLTAEGKIPHEVELEKRPEISLPGRAWLMGRVAGAIHDIKPAKEIVDEMITTAAQCIRQTNSYLVPQAKL